MGHLQVSKLIPAKRGELFRFITELRNVSETLGPASFLGLEVDFPSAVPQLKEKTEFECVFKRFGRIVPVQARVDEFVPGERFVYSQVNGFFRSWSHMQVLFAHDENLTLMTDLVDFTLPYGVIGALMDDLFVRKDLEQILKVRQLRIEEHFKNFAETPGAKNS